MNWSAVALTIGALLIAGLIYQTIRKNPDAFQQEALSKSFHTLGILALLLIGFVTLVVWFLRSV